MTAGLQVINDSGVFQIDDTYKNLQLISKTAVTTMTQVASGSMSAGLYGYWYYDIVVTSATNPVVALGGNASNWLIVGAVNISGGTWTFRVYSDSDVDFTYYVFDVPTTSGSFGLEVFNSSGALQYTSGRYPFRPVQLVTAVIGDGEKTTTLASGRTYAIATVATGRTAAASSSVGDPKIPTPDECSQYHYIGGFKINGVTLKQVMGAVNWYQQYRSDSYECGLISGYEGEIAVLVVDVTNF